MFDLTPFPDQIIGDSLSVTLCCTPLCTHQTKGRWDLPQALGQDVSYLVPQAPITLTPILTINKDIAELHH